MNKTKRWLARIMAVAMLFSLLPGSAFASLLPLQEKTHYADLGNYFREELGKVSIYDLTGDTAFLKNSDNVTVWTKWGYWDENDHYVSSDDNYTLLEGNKTIDLSNIDTNGSVTVELIVGDDMDQLDPDNVRHRVYVELPPEEERLSGEIVSTADRSAYPDRATSKVDEKDGKNKMSFWTEIADFGNGEFYLNLDISDDRGCDVEVYEGYYEKANQIPSGAENIADEIWAQGDLSISGGYQVYLGNALDHEDAAEFTAVFKRGGKIVKMIPVVIAAETQVYESVEDLMNITLYKDAEDDSRESAGVLDVWQSYFSEKSNNYGSNETTDKENGKNLLYICVDNPDWSEDGKFYLGLNEKEELGCAVKIYEGYYRTAEEIPENAKEITSKIWAQKDLATKGGYHKDFSYKSGYAGMPEITIVFERGDGVAVRTLPLVLYAYRASMSLNYWSDMYKDGESFRERVGNGYNSSYSDGHRDITVRLKEGYPADGEYYYNVYMYKPGDNFSSIDNVKKAVVGNYEKVKDIPKDAEDIKTQLFSSASDDGGYCADYSKGVTFTVVDIWNAIHRITVKTQEYVAPVQPDEPEYVITELPEAPVPFSQDTYFSMEGVDGNIDYYQMPHTADSYYFNGFQTLFLLNSDGTPVTEDKIVPEFYAGNDVDVFAGHDNVSGVEQVSGKTAVDFEHGKPILYSAAAEDQYHLKNYWVTFLTQQAGGPSLYVNGINDESQYVEVENKETGKKELIPEREVFLVEEYGNHHDVFIANVGDEKMNGIYVRLEDAVNVALDPYWTVGETRSLEAFTTTNDEDPNGDYVRYGHLSNFAKIRLVPELDSNGKVKAGKVSGTLVIYYTGGDGEIDEQVRINLSGVAKTPKITTKTIVDGVKFVPYSSVIQTNNMYSSYAVKFSISEGALPAGLSIKANGEIYGIPTNVGKFTFTVRAAYEDGGYDEKQFTLEIAKNTDENVEKENEGRQGYMLLDRVGEVDVRNEVEIHLFHSVGIYDDFKGFYIDGVKLVEGVDYERQEGSTKITIRAQAFRNAGNGTHTIAAEFRAGGRTDGFMKKTAQNVTVLGAPEDDGFIGGGSVSTTDKTEEEKKDETQTTAGFVDVPADAYYAAAVKWAIEKGITNGTSSTTFSPNAPCTRAQMLTFLYRAMGSPAVNGDVSGFTDVPAGAYYEDVVVWAVENGITKGVAEGVFAPNLNCTRAQIVTSIFRTVGGSTSGGSGFADVPAGTYYADAVAWAVAQGITNGTGNGMFSPDAVCTRAQMVTFLYRCFAE